MDPTLLSTPEFGVRKNLPAILTVVLTFAPTRLPSVGRCYAVIHDPPHATTKSCHCVRAGASRSAPGEGTLAGGAGGGRGIRPHISIPAGARTADPYPDGSPATGQGVGSQRGITGEQDAGRAESRLTS